MLFDSCQDRSHISKIGRVHLSFLPYKRPTTAVKGVEGRGMGRRVWCAILCDFTHPLVHLTAAWKWEIPTFLYWLVGLMFPFNFFGVSDTLTWVFGVSGHPRHPKLLRHLILLIVTKSGSCDYLSRIGLVCFSLWTTDTWWLRQWESRKYCWLISSAMLHWSDTNVSHAVCCWSCCHIHISLVYCIDLYF